MPGRSSSQMTKRRLARNRPRSRRLAASIKAVVYRTVSQGSKAGSSEATERCKDRWETRYLHCHPFQPRMHWNNRKSSIISCRSGKGNGEFLVIAELPWRRQFRGLTFRLQTLPGKSTSATMRPSLPRVLLRHGVATDVTTQLGSKNRSPGQS